MLILAGTLLCACNGVFGYWFPTSKMAAQSDLYGAEADRLSALRDAAPHNVDVATAQTRRNDILLPYAAAKTKARCAVPKVFF